MWNETVLRLESYCLTDLLTRKIPSIAASEWASSAVRKGCRDPAGNTGLGWVSSCGGLLVRSLRESKQLGSPNSQGHPKSDLTSQLTPKRKTGKSDSSCTKDLKESLAFKTDRIDIDLDSVIWWNVSCLIKCLTLIFMDWKIHSNRSSVSMSQYGAWKTLIAPLMSSSVWSNTAGSGLLGKL